MGGVSSKVQFERIVKQLTTKDIEPTDHDFWDNLWKTDISTEEIFELISATDVRKVIYERPNNLRTLFTQAVAQLFQVVETPYPVYFDQALNCARILARILPFMLESNSEFAKNLCWQKQLVQKEKSTVGASIDGNSTHTISSSSSGSSGGNDAGTTNAQTQEGEPLAVILVNAIFHLLFLPDFTIEDPQKDFSDEDIHTQEFKNALMWAPGVGSQEKSVVSSTEYDMNRVEILRVMIASFSEALYQNPDTYDSCASIWLEVATAADAPYAEVVLYSLLNTVLGYDPVGWGMPYGNLVAKDTAKVLMESAIQVLIILLDYGHPIGTATSTSGASGLPFVGESDTDAQGFNVFRRYLSKIEDTAHLNFIYRGFVRLLNNVHQSESSYLPFSITRISIEQELLVLFWKCIEEIPKFMPYILRQCDVTSLLVPICYLMLEGRKDPSKLGLMYLCTFTLLKLSGERNFGVALNQPYQLTLPVDVPPFTGNYSDLLVIVLHKMIVSGVDKLSALYNCFLTIICNVSPYCKSLGTVASVKIVNLFQLFTSPRFLYASESNNVYVSLLLETLNNIVQYQYEGNVNLVYAIVRRKELFEAIATLTLANAIKTAMEIADRRLQKLTEKAAARGAKGGPIRPPIVKTNTATTANRLTNGSGGGGGSATPSSHPPTAGGGLGAGGEGVLEEVKPTGLISTAAVERRLHPEIGEEIDIATRPTTNPGGGGAVSGGAGGGNGPSRAHPGLRFLPTEAWLAGVKPEQALNTLMRLLRYLVPQVAELAATGGRGGDGGAVDELQVIEFIKRTTMVGLLPVPHPIIIRKYQPNRYTCLWFTAFQWGVIFMHNQAPVTMFDGKHVKLFVVQTTA